MLNIQNLRPWEKIELVLKRHWIVYVILWLYFFLAIISTITLYVFFGFTVLINLLVIIFWMFMVNFFLIEWLNHELDMYVVSNNRIIWVEQKSFLNRAVSECNLGQVQEVNSRTKWFFSNMFNYWTLSIQTAWNKTTMQMNFCPNSMHEARKILNIVDQYWENTPDIKINKKWKN
jgi:hypothetical protein